MGQRLFAIGKEGAGLFLTQILFLTDEMFDANA